MLYHLKTLTGLSNRKSQCLTSHTGTRNQMNGWRGTSSVTAWKQKIMATPWLQMPIGS